MLIDRQKEILTELYHNSDVFLTAKELAAKYKVSLRTLKNDLSEIKSDLNGNGAHLLSISSKGNQLIIDDAAVFLAYYEKDINNNQANNSYYEQSSRVNHIMRKLINNTSVNPEKLVNELFISRSTLSNDLKVVRKILEKYDIKVQSNRNSGIFIEGKEENIRRCILRENLLRLNATDHNTLPKKAVPNDILSKIKNILLEVFVNNEIVVSDFVFQNLVVHIYTSLWRMQNEYYVTESPAELDASYYHVQVVAQEIMKNVCRICGVKYSQYESDLLAINIQGKREVYEKEYISKEIDDFIFHALTVIKDQHQIDFLDNIDLRISLALHTYPLISRMNSNLLLKNSMTYEIKQNYILAFDIASTFAYELYKKYNVKINDDEISYIALHFMNEVQSRNHPAYLKVLLISPEKKSNTFLVRQKFNKWFKDDIESFDVIYPSQIGTIHINDYDAVFTTDRFISEKYNMVYIDLFPDESNYQRIEFALNGFHSAKDIVSKFYQELFLYMDFSDKNDAIDFLCKKATDYFQLDQTLTDSVKEHEDISASYFGHSVAILHPVSPVTDTTFIAAMVLKKPIDWGYDQVQFVLLVSIEKNNPKALALWYYLSFLISNQKLIDSIIQNPTFSYFSALLLELYEHMLEEPQNK